MKQARVLYEMMRADFLERVRRYSFLLTLAGALYLAYGVATEKVWLVVGDGYRGVYNSAWIGALMSICCSTFLSLAGFYVVKNTIQRDVDTRVGRILAATPMRKSFYTAAKTISNFSVLASMVAVLMLAAVVMQLLHAEVRQISLWKLWAPFLFAALPAMAITAALAVLFETLPLLRGGLGNVIYFFAWTAGLGLSVTGMNDPTGLQVFYRSMHDALEKIDPATKEGFSLTIGGERAVHTFNWNGVDWTVHIIASRLLWVFVAGAVALLAAVFFHRFDPAYEWSLRRKREQQQPATNAGDLAISSPPVLAQSARSLTPLAPGANRWPLPQLVASELRLMLKGQRWWWYTVAAGLLIAQLAAPGVEVRHGVLVFAWLWPLLVWSQMGCREARCATQSLIFSSERALTRQLPAVWIAGVLLALLTGAGFGVRALLSADWHGFAPWLAGALFIPSLALALGVWSGSSKFFEALYTVWWYVGPANHSPGLDFIGTTSASSNSAFYPLAAGVLLAAAYMGRRARMGYA
jgi:hypothetical protein